MAEKYLFTMFTSPYMAEKIIEQKCRDNGIRFDKLWKKAFIKKPYLIFGLETNFQMPLIIQFKEYDGKTVIVVKYDSPMFIVAFIFSYTFIILMNLIFFIPESGYNIVTLYGIFIPALFFTIIIILIKIILKTMFPNEKKDALDLIRKITEEYSVKK